MAVITELTGQRNSTGGAASTSVTFTYPSTPTQNNLLVAVFTWRGDTTVTGTPSGWSLATNSGNGSGIDGAIYYKVAGAGESTTHTWTLGASNKFAGCASEWSGCLTSSVLDKVNSNTGSGTAGTCGLTGTLSQANELVVAMFGNIDIYTWSAHDNSSAEILEKASTGGSTSTRNNTSLATRIVSSTTSVDYGATLSTSGTWTSAVATFKADPSVSVALTGQSVSVAQESIVDGFSVALTGQSVPVAQESIGSSRTRAITSPGAATVDIGTIKAQYDVTSVYTSETALQLSGVTGAAVTSRELAQVQPDGTSRVPALGQYVTTAVGAVGSAVEVALTGQGLSLAIENIIADTGGTTVALTGQSISVSQEALFAALDVTTTGHLLSVVQETIAPSIDVTITGQLVSIASENINAESYYLITPSGGVVVTGNNSLIKTKIHVVSGGISFSGSNTLTVEKFYNISPSGGIVLSGTNQLTLTKSYTITPSGGITLSGTNALTVQKYYLISPSGGIVLSGNNTITPQYYYTISPNGGIVLSGNNAITYTPGTTTYIITPDGGITLSGSNTIIAQYYYTITPSGGVVLSGSVPLVVEKNYTITPSGGVVFSGNNPITVQHYYTITPNGGITLSGNNSIISFTPATYIISPNGGVSITGENKIIKTKIIITNGGIIFSGSNPITTNLININTYLPLSGVGQ